MYHEIVLLGKTKSSFLVNGITEYLERLQHYAKVTVKTIKTGAMQGSDEVIKQKEAALLLARLVPGTTLVALDAKGVQYTSTEFSRLINRWESMGVKHVSFVIGGPLGLDEGLLKRADHRISLSKMTFTHDMVRLFLLEQLYRAYTIKAGEKYHK